MQFLLGKHVNCCIVKKKSSDHDELKVHIQKQEIDTEIDFGFTW